MKYIDYYKVLGVTKDSNLDDIKKAYRKLARKYHPDLSKTEATESQFKEIAEAYATLKDPEKRAAYDDLGTGLNGADFSPPPQWNNTYNQGHESFEGMSLADLLEALQGQSRHSTSRQGPRKGQNYEDSISISLLDSLIGARINLQLVDEGKNKQLEVTIPSNVREGQKIRLAGMGAGLTPSQVAPLLNRMNSRQLMAVTDTQMASLDSANLNQLITLLNFIQDNAKTSPIVTNNFATRPVASFLPPDLNTTQTVTQP